MNKIFTAVAFTCVGLLSACDANQNEPGAMAEIKPTANNQAAGTLSFAPKGDKVLVTANITGLAAGSEHGFHIHEKGDCSAPDGSSAGGHFNPAGSSHGHYDGDTHHAGDMPNLTADQEGKAQFSVELSGVTLDQGETGLIGRGVVIHAGPDDYQSQPAGNSGARIACGVIVKN